MDNEDAYLVTLLKQESAEGFRITSLTYGPAIYSLALLLTGNPEDSREVTSDALMQVFRNIDSFNPDKGSLKSWILKIARNCSVTALRRRKRKPLMTELTENISEEASDAGPDESEMIKAAIAGCSADEQQLIHLYYYDDLPLAEIAEIMGVRAATLAVRLQRLRNKIKRIILNNGR
ncbi:MAG: sigma-70 family RNA polymerase sigma factor [Muribaculaceae bacterium]|nr:sigma-70 family RNA polymerase sigma factor [Muribaculaceae bacterium]